jgi:hypothetical protein
VRTVLARLRPSWLREPGGPDPFETLMLQQRLSRLSSELRAIDHPGYRARGSYHHAKAAQEAYERTLDDACRLAGLPVEPGRGPSHRLLAEARLMSAGWRW